MNLEEVMGLLYETTARIQRESDELRADRDRLAKENSELCDRVFELRQKLGGAETVPAVPVAVESEERLRSYDSADQCRLDRLHEKAIVEGYSRAADARAYAAEKMR